MTKLGDFLKLERNKRALTQAQMAERLLISTTWYKLLELGRAKAGVSTLQQIAKLTRRSTRFIYSLNKED